MGQIQLALIGLIFMQLLSAYQMLHRIENETQCQHRPCRCVSKFKVNCSHSLLTEIPVTVGADANILDLDISSNRLSSLNASLLPSHLKVLHFRENRIRVIDEGDLYELKDLIFLHLDNNNITFIHPEALSASKRLEILTLGGNKFHLQSEETESDVYMRPLINAPNLRVLDTSNCSFTMLSDIMFEKVPYLQDLRLSHNQLRFLKDDTFRHLGFLKTLLLRKNFLSKLHKYTFSSLRKLEVLDLAYNCLNFLDEPGLFDPLINLYYLDLSGNGLKHLHPTIFSKLSSLRILNLNQNLLNRLNNSTFYGLNQLTTLDLSDNRLETISFYSMFCENNQLSYLKLTNNFMMCDNCYIWNIWQWKNKRKISAFLAKCNGEDIDRFFDSNQKRIEMLQSIKNCSLVTVCQPLPDERIADTSISLVYVYGIAGAFLLFLLFGILLTGILFRCHFRLNQKQIIADMAASTISIETKEQYSTRAEQLQMCEELKKRQELFKKSEEERLKLQRELYFQHQKAMKRHQQRRYREAIERSRQEREAKSQELTAERLDTNEIAHYRDEGPSRLPSVADDEREWYRADTLPVRDQKKKTVYCSAANENACSNHFVETNGQHSTRQPFEDQDEIENEYWYSKNIPNDTKSSDGAHEVTTEIAYCPQNVFPIFQKNLTECKRM